MDAETIKTYFERGKERGFSREYVRQILLDKGYDAQQVNYVYNSYLTDERLQQAEQPPKRSWTMPLVIAVVALFVVGGFFFLTSSDAGITGHAVKEAQAQLDEITKLNDEITEEKLALEAQLAQLQNADLTIQQKNEIIEEQVTRLEELHKKMNKERDQIRQLLWELLNAIVSRGN